jgi:hypothetical protein
LFLFISSPVVWTDAVPVNTTPEMGGLYLLHVQGCSHLHYTHATHKSAAAHQLLSGLMLHVPVKVTPATGWFVLASSASTLAHAYHQWLLESANKNRTQAVD